MTEETLFAAALEKATPDERSAFLDDACSGDPAMRQRVEALLQSHEQADFLNKPAVDRPAEDLVGAATTGTEAHSTDGDDAKASLHFLVPSAKPDSLGRLGHYEVLEVIGRGGMGIVLRAFDDKLHRTVAIKVLASSMPTNGATRKRFTREARAAAAIHNEHVVGIYAVEEAAELPYLVMEYIDGVSLQERLDRGGALEVKEILRIGMQIATGLAAAHAQGLVHRDIKPANILLENHVERVKITDFGLARAMTDASLTQEGVVAGTPQYMAPEQARGQALDHRADLFGLGSVLYALCTGRPPFRAENTLAVLKRVCEDAPRPIREINPDVPPWLVEIIAKLQAKAPGERFQSAQEVAEVLGRELAAVQRGDVERPPTPDPAPLAKRSRRLAVAAAMLFLFIAGFVVTELIGITNLTRTVFHRPRQDEPPSAKVDESKREAGNADGAAPPTDKKDVPPSKPPAPPDPLKPFVILANAGRGEQKFATLAEAVADTGSGDTIEIRGDGPFVNPALNLKEKDLVIRAGPWFRPVLQMSEEGFQTKPHFWTDRRLVLEGLEFHRVGGGTSLPDVGVVDSDSPLWIANCRFILKNLKNKGSTWNAAGFAGTSPIIQIRNCHFAGVTLGNWTVPSGGQMTIEGNVVMDNAGLSCQYKSAKVKQVVLRLTHNTISTHGGLHFGLHSLPEPVGSDGKMAVQPLRVTASENILGIQCLVSLTQLQMYAYPPGKAVSAIEADAVLRRLVDWQEHRNLYSPRGMARSVYSNASPRVPLNNIAMRLADWEQYWGLKDTGSSQDRYVFRSRVSSDAMPGDAGYAHRHMLDMEDFRLARGSAGEGASGDGRDLGADIDLVGPGPTYERWKKTPAYQQWLKDSGQKK